MLRRTKIVATLGPASLSESVLARLIESGVNMVRVNFSHGDADQHRQVIERVRSIAAQQNAVVAVMADLQGPKIRIGRFAAGTIALQPGQHFCLDAACPLDAGDRARVGLTYKALPGDCGPGDRLLLDDGRIQLEVLSVVGTRIETRVELGGPLSDNKGLNRQGGGLSAPALTEKDRRDIQLAAQLDVDYLAVSFPRSADDIEQARALLRAAGGQAAIMGKIERAELVHDETALRALISACDAVMVARGDLGVELGDAELIGAQKHLITLARQLNRPVVTATQMMESMIHNNLPTRAEVFDVANAVLDGTDAVMLSAETATGDCPGQVVQAMARICLGAEKQPSIQVSTHRMEWRFSRIDETVAMAAMYAANHLKGVVAIVCLTETGSTPLLMSRISSGLPIYALTRHPRTLRRCALYRGVEALPFDLTRIPLMDVDRSALKELVQRRRLQPGDQVMLTRGDQMGVEAGTNTLKVL